MPARKFLILEWHYHWKYIFKNISDETYIRYTTHPIKKDDFCYLSKEWIAELSWHKNKKPSVRKPESS